MLLLLEVVDRPPFCPASCVVSPGLCVAVNCPTASKRRVQARSRSEKARSRTDFGRTEHSPAFVCNFDDATQAAFARSSLVCIAGESTV